MSTPNPNSTTTNTNISNDARKLRLQDSGELIEGLYRNSDPRTAIPAAAKVLKDHRDNLNSLLRVAVQQDLQLSSLTTLVENIDTSGSGSSDIGIIAYA